MRKVYIFYFCSLAYFVNTHSAYCEKVSHRTSSSSCNISKNILKTLDNAEDGFSKVAKADINDLRVEEIVYESDAFVQSAQNTSLIKEINKHFNFAGFKGIRKIYVQDTFAGYEVTFLHKRVGGDKLIFEKTKFIDANTFKMSEDPLISYLPKESYALKYVNSDKLNPRDLYIKNVQPKYFRANNDSKMLDLFNARFKDANSLKVETLRHVHLGDDLVGYWVSISYKENGVSLIKSVFIDKNLRSFSDFPTENMSSVFRKKYIESYRDRINGVGR